MSELKKQILDDIKEAMKAKDSTKLGTLRMVSAAIKQVEVDERKELSESEIVAILLKSSKQRKESIAQFKTANRQDLVDIEEAELKIIQSYLPEQKVLTEEDIKQIIKKLPEITGVKDMSKVMAQLKTEMGASLDMGLASQLVKKVLAEL